MAEFLGGWGISSEEREEGGEEYGEGCGSQGNPHLHLLLSQKRGVAFEETLKRVKTVESQHLPLGRCC